ncbi:nucleotidyltransferase domain-containing protein [Promicromonospora sp. Marseille-Q5078]
MGERTTARRPLAQVLVDSVAPEGATPSVGLAGIALEQLAEAAQDHRVLPAVAKHAAVLPDCPEAWRAPLRRARDEQVVRHLGVLAELDGLGKVLDGADVPWAVCKGPAATVLWPAPDMREYYDLDLYVPRASFGEAVAALEEAGCVPEDRNWPLMAASRRAEYALRGPFGVHVDLHWDVAVPEAARRTYRMDHDAMIDRRRLVDMGGGRSVPTFDPVDTVLVLAFHAAQSGAGRLMWLVDVTGAVEACGPRSAEIGARARSMRVDVPVGLVLERAARVLGGRGETGLGGQGLLGSATALLDARHGFPDLPGDAHRSGRLYSSARPSATGTAAALVRDALANRRIERAIRRGVPGADEKALRVDVPDAGARADYFRFVDSGSG